MILELQVFMCGSSVTNEHVENIWTEKRLTS